MKKQINKKMIGLFFVLGIGALILILMGSVVSRFWKQNTYMAVMYFEESTQGLNVGSPVLFNGVQMGKVVKISLEADPETFTFKVPVYVQLTPIGISRDNGWRQLLEHRDDALARLIHQGLRARLRTQSYLTGQLMIELNMEPDAPLTMMNHWMGKEEPEIPEIPTLISASEKISKGLEEVQFQNAFERVDAILTTLDRQLPKLLESLTKTSQNLEKITGAISSDTLNKTDRTLTEVSEAMRSLRNLTDYLEQYPESLLKGKK